MLSTIKDMINNKEEMLESSATIYEDIIDDIENYITEDSEIDDSTDADDKPEDSKDEEEKDGEDDEDNKDDTKKDKDKGNEIGAGAIDNLDDLDLSDHVNPDSVIDEPEGNLNATNLDNLDDMPLDQDLGDITNVELNVSTNNLADVLPVPPTNAADAVVSDTMTTTVDDGFDNEPVTNNTMESVDDGLDDFELFSEAITIDANANDKPEADKPEDEKPIDDNEENNVTSAVLDKVNDVNTEIEPDKDSKDKLLDKLDKLNRGILDLKENIKKQLS